MNFAIDTDPPTEEEIATEREQLRADLRRTRLRDNAISFLLIIITSALVSATVYWFSNSIRYAAIAATVFPVIGVVLTVLGIITPTGFRSAARHMIELNHQLVALNPVAVDGNEEIEKLRHKYHEVAAYLTKVQERERDLVTGELAMFWEWDATTLAKQEKKSDFIERAKHSLTT